MRDVLTNPTVGSSLDLDELRPEFFADAPEVLVPLAAELLWRGAFERGTRALTLARQCHIDSESQPELAVRMALVDMLFCAFVGEFDVALEHRERARGFESRATGVGDWVLTLDTLAMYCHGYLGHLDAARGLAEELTVVGSASASLTDVLCTGVLSQAAFLEGELAEAADLADRALRAASELSFDRHYFVFHALRTTGQLAFERRDFAAATDAVERALGIVTGARPCFNFLAQIDRARVWAATGSAEAALASLPAARAALKSERSPLHTLADELEARVRLQLGDLHGARAISRRLPEPRRRVVEVIADVAAGELASADRLLSEVAGEVHAARVDAELQLLRAAVAVARSESYAPAVVRHALASARRVGLFQTVLDTAPQVVDHVLANPDLYPDVPDVGSLLAALGASRSQAGTARRGDLVVPLTPAEIRVLAHLQNHLSNAEIAAELFVSLNTVKTQLKSAYTKLGVNSRAGALARASALGLL